MRFLPRPLQAGALAALGLATVAMTSGFSAVPASASSSPSPRFTALANSVPATTDHRLGTYTSSRMPVEISLAPSHQAALASALRADYTKGSGRYHQWLKAGQFDARYAPSAAERAAVTAYLRGQGLSLTKSASPFLVSAVGSSARIESAFRTSLSSYRDSHGTEYFANSTAVQLPATIAGGVLGVIGLTNTVREHPGVQRVPSSATAARGSGSAASCETPYVTRKQLFTFVNKGVGFPYGYGGGPGCSGLTPAQTNSIYGAPKAGVKGKGSGATAAVFELSNYLPSDIATWAHHYYGAKYTPKLQNVLVDGGPSHIQCPPGDTCPPAYNGYSGDVEVNADIEMELAVAPDVSKLLVYNAPNDFTGQTELDEYTRMAENDLAETVSSSWSSCENDVTTAYVQSENVVFEQMAMQGQSVFDDNQDTGAFGCIRGDGTDVVNVQDPSSQPWVTSVGGTSLESDNPGTSTDPSYPQGTETVWNTDNLCSNQAPGPTNDGQGGHFWCGETGAAGGGSSQYWGRPFYQYGPGVTNPHTHYANGKTRCVLASDGTPCRETPDVSANADPYTGYSEYCTGNASTPHSECNFSSGEAVPGWFAIGGCSLSTPLWAAAITDRDSYTGQRAGNINPLMYVLFNMAPKSYFHDITGVGAKQKAATNNGLYPTTPGYDLATGIGSPKLAALITKSGL